ncbi:HipA family kinase [Vibrio sp. Vb2535]|jgi:hypothetical protein|uniref:HipA family kinase n=1 Tax=Vibrio TaxID=662 RepID=UPI0014832765|nr:MULTISPECIES: HipA family kinase [unclassified Vibrio]EGR0196170.1 hypothetical protein [Vibrio alginolyticus]EJG0024588.1 hypothetical protein [Vibrio alginolyticus]EJS0370563.1 hypothetical protein [Vibrio alginolyticus]MDW1752409.1 HipA family kinase [Vibrio sp. Vb2535]NNN64463.1 hypothetical protein [Vibrio sp. 2-1(7)]
MAKQPEICIAQVIREMKQGFTSPYLCKDDQDQQFVVKGRRANREGLVKEWICATLGTEFGLPIPNYSMAWADAPFQSHRELFENNFASSFIANIQDVTPTTLEGLEQQFINDLYMFDYWVKNADRNQSPETGKGNPNLFIHQQTGEPYVIDHNLAFDSTFCVEQHKALHVCSQKKKWASLFEVERQRYEQMFDQALSKLDEAINEIDEEWLEGYSVEQINAEIRPILELYKTNKFWEDIE